MVVGQLLQLASAQEVGARVADMPERDGAGGIDERHRHGGAHPGSGSVAGRPLVHAPVRLPDESNTLNEVKKKKKILLQENPL